MLKSMVIKDFKSFKNATHIDMSATKYSFLKDTNVYDGVVKGVMFAGQNASGKTNAIKAIKLLLDLFFRTKNFGSEPLVCLFGSGKDLAQIKYEFFIEDSIINYEVEFTSKNSIKYEHLTLNGKTMLERKEKHAFSILSDRQEFDENDVDEKTVFLRKLYFNTRFTSFPILKKWWAFLENSIYVNAIEKTASIYNDDEYVALEDYVEKKKNVRELNEFFEAFGFDQQVEYKKQKRLSDRVYANADQETIFMKRKNINLWFPIAIESLGNQTLLNILPSLLYSVKNPGMLLLDEFNSAFHNELEELLLRFFFKHSKRSQTFFVSHSTNLMKTTLLRPDQIYTFTFDDEEGTKIKRVSSESPRQSQNMEKMYLSGMFEGLPKYRHTERND